MLETSSLHPFIFQTLSRFYRIEAHTLTLLPIGADLNTAVYKAHTHEGSFFVKLVKGARDGVSAAVIELLQIAGFQHIIAPVKTIDGRAICEVEGVSVSVYPFVEGVDGFSQALTDEQWRTLGQALRMLHEINIPDALRKQLRSETYSAHYREEVLALYARLPVMTVRDEVSQAFLASLGEYAAVIHRLITRAGELAERVKHMPAPFVLCHADIHAGNVLIDTHHSIYIVDWDAPMLAPKERDVMFIGGGVANVWNRPEEEALFYQGYGKTEINHAMLAYYRHERVVQDIAEFAEAIFSAELSNASKEEYYQYFIAMFAPDGVVDCALRT